jgi:protein ImuB
MPAPQYLCICAREFPTQALLRLRTELHSTAVAVLHGIAPTETVCATNAKARRLGIARDMTRIEAESFPQLVLLRRSPAQEHSAKTALLECAGRFSPEIEDVSNDSECSFVLNIAGTAKLFGEPHAVAVQIRETLATIGIHASVCVSHNFHVSLAKAKILHGIEIIPPGAERKSLAPLPLHVLGLSDTQAETFANWGIRNIGELASLPDVDLITRLGQDAKRLLELSRGERPHMFLPIEPVTELRESFEFETPIEILDSLFFILSPMFEHLIARVSLQALCVASLKIEMQLDGGRVHERIIRPALPTVDKRFLLKLAQLDLAAHPPFAPVQSLAVTAEPGRGSKVQLGLFAPQLPESSRLDVTLSRLSALVGEDRVGSPILRDTHAPDSFRHSRFSIQKSIPNDLCANSHTALRRIRPPALLSVQSTEHRPTAFTFREHRYAVRNAYGPWRSSGEWWTTDVWSQEEWDVVAEAGCADNSAGNNFKDQLCGVLVRDRFFNLWRMVAIYD